MLVPVRGKYLPGFPRRTDTTGTTGVLQEVPRAREMSNAGEHFFRFHVVPVNGDGGGRQNKKMQTRIVCDHLFL